MREKGNGIRAVLADTTSNVRVRSASSVSLGGRKIPSAYEACSITKLTWSCFPHLASDPRARLKWRYCPVQKVSRGMVRYEMWRIDDLAPQASELFQPAQRYLALQTGFDGVEQEDSAQS